MPIDRKVYLVALAVGVFVGLLLACLGVAGIDAGIRHPSIAVFYALVGLAVLLARAYQNLKWRLEGFCVNARDHMDAVLDHNSSVVRAVAAYVQDISEQRKFSVKNRVAPFTKRQSRIWRKAITARRSSRS